MFEQIQVLIRVTSIEEKEGFSTFPKNPRRSRLADIDGFFWDKDYEPVLVDWLFSKQREPLLAQMRREQPTENAYYVRRGRVENEVAFKKLIETVEADTGYINIFIDQEIEFYSTAPVPNTSIDSGFVLELLGSNLLHERQMNGNGVYVGIVDSGLNLEYLREKGIDVDLLKPAAMTHKHFPGKATPGHGTMCSFNACIIATNCILIDCASLLRIGDLLPLYSSLGDWLESSEEEDLDIRLVLNNSWGVKDPRSDDSSNRKDRYIDNPNHDFNRLVQELGRTVDILFAAGNTGNRTDRRGRGIFGANSLPQVLCVGGVNTKGNLVDYSSRGPGCLHAQKPDLCTYTEFVGSEVGGSGTIDDGTSTACAVASGVVAAIRTLYPVSVLPPEELRRIMRATAIHPHNPDPTNSDYHDYDYGYGIMNVPGIIQALEDLPTLPLAVPFSTLVKQEPQVLIAIKKISIAADTTLTTNFVATEVILRSIAFPLTEHIIRSIGLPWLDSANYSALWQSTVEQWIADHPSIDIAQARVVADHLNQTLQNTPDRTAWERLLGLIRA